MTDFISNLHTELRNARLTQRGATHKASDVPHGLHKEYPRMPRIALPEPVLSGISLEAVLSKRLSAHTGDIGTVVPLPAWGTLLGGALKKRPASSHRPYPSGGALYPIETYVLMPETESGRQTVYHYNPTLHTLEILWPLDSDIDLRTIVPKPDTLDFSALIVFTSVWKRSSAKYGDFTYGLSLLEAGHMSQNILLCATALGIHARPMAGFNDALLIRALDIDPLEEKPVHTVTISMPPRP